MWKLWKIFWGIFPKSWEFSKTIVEISSTYFWGIFPTFSGIYTFVWGKVCLP